MFTEYSLIIALCVILGLFEMCYPAEKNQSVKGRLRNIVYGIILLTVGGGLAFLIKNLIPIQPREIEMGGILKVAGLLLVYMFSADFCFYWYHRAQHRFAWLWQIHELHHSDTELNATTSLRSYWLERPVQFLVVTLPSLYLIGFHPIAFGLLPFFLTSWLFFTHANLRLSLGRLTPFLTGPQMHRIHHSTLDIHNNKNFAQIFPVIDILFGTYYRPAPAEFPPTGTMSLASSTPISDAIKKPFHEWGQLILRIGRV